MALQNFQYDIIMREYSRRQSQVQHDLEERRKEAFIRVEDGEMYIYGMHISPYEKGNIFNKDPLRVRKLLLHKKEILKIFGKMKEQGITVVPLQVYFSGSLVKIEIGLAKGKKLYDKRETITKKDQKREAQREFKAFNR